MGAIASSPTMVGAITVLIVIVAVFLAYNANTGLPFVPTYRISAEVPNANALVPSNEVRIGGVRVGLVEDVVPVQHEDGSTSARLDLKLDDEVRELPEDSTVIVRSRSALGLKYLEINQGHLERGDPRGRDDAARAAPARAGRDRPGAEHVRRADPAGDPAQPGRVRERDRRPRPRAQRGDRQARTGPRAPPAGGAHPRRPDTQLGRFVEALRDTAAEVAPVAEVQARMFVALDTTFGALAGSRARSSRRRSRGRRRRSRPRSGRCRRSGRSCATRRGCSPTSRRARGRWGEPRPRSPTRRRSGSRRCSRRRASTASSRRPPRRCAVQRRRRRARRHRPADHVLERAQPHASLHHPGPVDLQLRDAAVQQRRRHAAARQQPRQLAAVQPVSAPGAPEAPNNEGVPSSAPASGGGVETRRTSCTSTPTRTPRRPVSPRSARPAASSTSPAGP